MARKRQLVLLKLEDADDRASPTVPLGRMRDVLDIAARFNTAPDGTEGAGSTHILHGPGVVMEIAPGDGEVRQALVTCNDEELAWPILRGICKAGGWTMQDIESGAMFG